MPSLQEWIHKLEEGAGARYIKLTAMFLGLLALTAIYDIREFKNFFSQEAMDTAQLARNIATGKGYTTQFIRPFSVLLMQQAAEDGLPVMRDEHPDLENPPVYPLILAGLMKVLPFRYETKAAFNSYQPEIIIGLFNQLLFFGAIFLVYRIAARLFDTSVAAVAAAIFACADLFWRFSVSGLPTMLLVLLLLLITWLLVVMEQNHREAKRGTGWLLLMSVLVGLLVGIAGMTRYSCLVLLVPVTAFLALFFGNRGLALMSSALAACILVAAPWLIRNYNLCHAPFGTAGYAIYQGTERFPGNRLDRYFSTDLKSELGRIGPNELVRKVMVNGSKILSEQVPSLGGTWLAGFFLASLLIRFQNPALQRLRVFALLTLAVLVVAQALATTHLTTDAPVVNSENLLVIAAPLVFLFGTGLFFILLDQIEFEFVPFRTLSSAAFSVVMCLPLIFTLLPPRSYAPAWPPYWPPRIREVGSWLAENELMMSDMPWAVAWYGNRKCVWTTLDAPSDSPSSSQTDFFHFYDSQKPISGLYLTHITGNGKLFDAGLRSPEIAWTDFMLRSVFKSSIPNGFPLKVATPGFMEDGQLFLSDRVRWKKNPR